MGGTRESFVPYKRLCRTWHIGEVKVHNKYLDDSFVWVEERLHNRMEVGNSMHARVTMATRTS